MPPKSVTRAPARRAAAPAAPRTRLEVDARRAQLIELGLELFSANTYDDVSIDDFARRSGVSKGLLYHYFPTKRDFYVATIREASRQLVERTTVASAGTAPENLRAGLDAYLDYVEHRGAAYAALLRGGVGSDPEVAAIVQETRRQFLGRLIEGLGIVDPPPILRVALWGWLGFVEGASLDWVERRDVSRAEVRDVIAGVLPATIAAAVGPDWRWPG